jgi:hypothetical protein
VPPQKKIESVLAMSPADRYAYLVRKVADTEELWSLASSDGEWVLAGDDEGHELVPIWPEAAFAARCASGAWAGTEPRSIPMDVWLGRWIPGMTRDGRLVAVFPTPENTRGVVREPAQIRDDLEQELEQYE